MAYGAINGLWGARRSPYFQAVGELNRSYFGKSNLKITIWYHLKN